ncbi:MAG: 2-C-methyl-D-erythritol 4-phosphate cytidylyltransferase [Oscillospiraceae bacterium]|nr:2-C-methyl-D-erythritol 4-phosphate cytidylyltransferase [Oscillospiraceae bacterium]
MRVSAFRTGKDEISRLFVIIPAAGNGSRVSDTENKLFMNLDGIPVIERTLFAFDQFLNRMSRRSAFTLQTVVVTAEENIFKIKRICEKNNFAFVKDIVPGGETRQESVWNGILALSSLPFPPGEEDVVFIHDGARCLIDQATLDRCLKASSMYDVCAPSVPVKSTIKQTDKDDSGAVLSTPDRETLQEIQTPQVFRYNVLVEAYSSANRRGRVATDDTSLAEAIGAKVRLVEGAYSNIKITTPEDFAIAESFLQSAADVSEEKEPPRARNPRSPFAPAEP